MSKFLIVGLGNIGDEYANTRHNIGFDVVFAFVQKHGGSFKVDRLAYVAEVKFKGKQFVCICPTTYMNLSGRAFKYWQEKEKVLTENTLTILDDLSLPIDKLRLRKSGTHAGHNGLRDIITKLNDNEFYRLRIGIARPNSSQQIANYVLSAPNKADCESIVNAFTKANTYLEQIVLGDIVMAMNILNAKK